jgi:hypothetical protein
MVCLYHTIVPTISPTGSAAKEVPASHDAIADCCHLLIKFKELISDHDYDLLPCDEDLFLL